VDELNYSDAKRMLNLFSYANLEQKFEFGKIKIKFFIYKNNYFLISNKCISLNPLLGKRYTSNELKF